jgi:hypothetical protein
VKPLATPAAASLAMSAIKVRRGDAQPECGDWAMVLFKLLRVESVYG